MKTIQPITILLSILFSALITLNSSYAQNSDDCEWMYRISTGPVVWFFDEENNLVGPEASLDVWRTDYPINFRIGVEGRHMFLGQDSAQFARQNPQDTTRVTYLRIPMSLEYIQPLDEAVNLYLGLGPDIIHTANDLEDTNVGMHIDARVHYAFTSSWGASFEAGYMWGDVDGDGPDVKLDGAYVLPQLSYTF